MKLYYIPLSLSTKNTLYIKILENIVTSYNKPLYRFWSEGHQNNSVYTLQLVIVGSNTLLRI